MCVHGCTVVVRTLWERVSYCPQGVGTKLITLASETCPWLPATDGVIGKTIYCCLFMCVV